MTCWQLAIETSARVGSIALFADKQLYRQIELPATERTAASLSVAMDALLCVVRDAGGQLDLISVTDGPGSFTGLRIGVTAAKTLAYAVNCKLTAVDTLAVIGQQCLDANPSIEFLQVGMKAYRGQIFTRTLDRNQPDIAETTVMEGTAWSHYVERLPHRWGLGGDAAGLKELKISSKIFLVDPQYWHPQAQTVGLLGAIQADEGHFVEPLALMPRYLRPSAAEEKSLPSTS